MNRTVKNILIFIAGFFSFLIFLIVIPLLIVNLRTLPIRPWEYPKPPICNKTDTLDHVYHPFRLVVYNHCITVIGKVTKLVKEPDGDTHIEVKLEPPYEEAINLGNKLFLNNTLMVEAVCVFPQSREYQKEACKGHANHVYIPKKGERIKIIGQYVFDTDHLWNEIHPAYAIIKM